MDVALAWFLDDVDWVQFWCARHDYDFPVAALIQMVNEVAYGRVKVLEHFASMSVHVSDSTILAQVE